MGAPELIVAGLSARMMTESAHAAGFEVTALDLFGDADTRHAAHAWEPIGNPATLTISAEATLAALQRLRLRPPLVGWVAGTGFEDQPDLLEAGARIVPLLGNPPDTVRLLKDPERFFGMLQELGIPHPETRLTPPDDPHGWLCKAIGGAGAWHIRPAEEARPGMHAYFQRQMPGIPMSVIFLAHQGGARGSVRILGINRQWIGQRSDVPYVFEGVSGPVTLPPQIMQRLADAVQGIARTCGLVGLNSLDFLFDAPDFHVLEVNPRPTAAMALYEDSYAHGLMHAHVQACQGVTPMPQRIETPAVRGCRTVFAEHEQHINASLSGTLMRAGWCHDIPVPGIRIGAGEPLCTVSACATSLAAVDALLHDRCTQTLDYLKALHVDNHVPSRRPDQPLPAQRQRP